MNDFITEWETGKKISEKAELLEKSWGVYPEQSPFYTHLCVGELTFQDMTDNSEYHTFLNYVQKFVRYYLKLAYICNLKSGLIGESPVMEKQINTVLINSPGYRNFQKIFPTLERNILTSARPYRIGSLYDKIRVFDLQTNIDVFAYIFIGYQDGIRLNLEIDQYAVNGKNIKQLESHCKNKAIHTKQSAFSRFILPSHIEMEYYKKISPLSNKKTGYRGDR